MTSVFLSGSRTLSRINDLIRQRLNNMIENNLSIMVGDANGADKAMQAHLAEQGYSNVAVFFVGNLCRNNVGNWPTENVLANPKLSGRNFYSQKDKKMAKIADFGLVLWDGKSAGSIENVFELIKNGKKAVVYYSPEKEFCNISDSEGISSLLKKCDHDVLDSLDKKLGFKRYWNEIEAKKQTSLSLF